MNYTIKCNALGNKKEFVQTSVVEWSYHCSGGAQLTSRCRELTTKFSRKRKAPTITLCQPVHWKVPTTQWKGQAMRGLNGNGLALSTQSIEEMKAEQREQFSLNHINKAELERCSGISRRKLRRFKRNGFRDNPRYKGQKTRCHKAWWLYRPLGQPITPRGQELIYCSGEQLRTLPETGSVRLYLCPERCISFDGFVNYKGSHF